MKSLLNLVNESLSVCEKYSGDAFKTVCDQLGVVKAPAGCMYIYGMLVNEKSKTLNFDKNFNKLGIIPSLILKKCNLYVDITDDYAYLYCKYKDVFNKYVESYFSGTNKGKYKLNMDFENPNLYKPFNLNEVGDDLFINLILKAIGVLLIIHVNGPTPYNKNTVKFDSSNMFLYPFSMFYQIDNVDFTCDQVACDLLYDLRLKCQELYTQAREYEIGEHTNTIYRNTCKNLNIYVKSDITKQAILPSWFDNPIFTHRGTIDNLVVTFEDRSRMDHLVNPWGLGFSSDMIKNIKYICEDGLNLGLAFTEDARFCISSLSDTYITNEISFIGKTFFNKAVSETHSFLKKLNKNMEWKNIWLSPIKKLTLDYRLVSRSTELGQFAKKGFGFEEINIVNADINYDFTGLASEMGLKNPDKYKYNIYDVIKSVFKCYPDVKINADDPKVLEKLKQIQKKIQDKYR